MRLSEFVAAAGLYVYAEVALVLFLIAFIAVLVDVAAKAHAKEFEHASLLPLDDGSPVQPRKEALK